MGMGLKVHTRFDLRAGVILHKGVTYNDFIKKSPALPAYRKSTSLGGKPAAEGTHDPLSAANQIQNPMLTAQSPLLAVVLQLRPTRLLPQPQASFLSSHKESWFPTQGLHPHPSLDLRGAVPLPLLGLSPDVTSSRKASQLEPPTPSSSPPAQTCMSVPCLSVTATGQG